MNIQPVSTNQNHQQNFGMQVKWTTEQNLAEKEAKEVITMGQQVMRTLLETLHPSQRIQLNTTLEEIEALERCGDVPLTMLEIQSSMTHLQLKDSPLKAYLRLNLLSMSRKYRLPIANNIVPHRLDGSHPLFTDETTATYAQGIGNEIISNLRSFIPKTPLPEVSAAELAGRFGITA